MFVTAFSGFWLYCCLEWWRGKTLWKKPQTFNKIKQTTRQYDLNEYYLCLDDHWLSMCVFWVRQICWRMRVSTRNQKVCVFARMKKALGSIARFFLYCICLCVYSAIISCCSFKLQCTNLIKSCWKHWQNIYRTFTVCYLLWVTCSLCSFSIIKSVFCC